MNIANSVISLVGNTPMVRLNRVAAGINASVVAKLEMFNPLGSVKDRIGVAMIEAAEREGKITTTPRSAETGDRIYIEPT